MSRKIKSGLIQMSLPMTEGEGTIKEIMDAMYDKHIPYIEEAGKQGVQILCLQEIFNTPYFCPGQDMKWYESAESVPGPTTEKMQVLAKKHNMVIIVPIYEKEQAGILYNTATRLNATKIALGHHRDDMLETLFLNMFNGGQLKSMPPKLVSDDGKQMVIRPLAMATITD